MELLHPEIYMLFFIDLNKNIEEIEEEINRVSCSPAKSGIIK
jgi:hypothetical protein